MNKLLITLMMAAGLAACSQESKQEAQEAASAVASEVQAEASSVQAAAQEAAPSAEAASTEAKPEEKAEAPAAEAKPEAKAEASVAVDGQKIFEASCKMCHGGTIPGAPVVGKKDDWAPRIAKGKETLHKHALEGFNAMPAKGGNAGLSDDEVKAAVDYMANQSGATFWIVYNIHDIVIKPVRIFDETGFHAIYGIRFFHSKLSYLRGRQSICRLPIQDFFTAGQAAQYLSPFVDCPDGLFGIGS